MKARRLGEILDECLSAYTEGRRSIEESLSLYPAIRDELEPRLRTAVEVADTFGESSPPEHVQERGRQEFLTSASVRQRAKLLTYDLNFGQRIGDFAHRRPRLLIVAGFAIALAVAGAVAARLETSSNWTNHEAASSSPSPLAPLVGDLRDTQQQLWRRANQGVDVSPGMIRALTKTTTSLDSQVGDFSALDSQARIDLERAIADQYLLLHLIANTQPAPTAPEARRALGVTQRVAGSWGIDLPQVPPAAPGEAGSQVDETAPSRQPSSATPSPSPDNETPAAGPVTPQSDADSSP